MDAWRVHLRRECQADPWYVSNIFLASWVPPAIGAVFFIAGSILFMLRGDPPACP